MSDYSRVADALDHGADPSMICQTCPWDRFCITPPDLTREEVKQQMADAVQKDKQDADAARAEGKETTLPVGVLLTALTVGGKDTSAQVCPVLVARLRSSDGRRVVDAVRCQMQAWDDLRVGTVEGAAVDVD